MWRDNRRRNRVQPDVFAVRLINGQVPSYPFKQSDLLLAVEVESPSTQDYDYETKCREYLSHGVAKYWVVSIEERTFTRWRSLDALGDILNERIMWQPEGMPDPLIIDISESFEDALG